MTTGFACGVFDLMHPGHILMLRDCKSRCDHLVVAINRAERFSEVVNPGKRLPLYTVDERVLLMRSIRYVDEVLTYDGEEELLGLLTSRHFDCRFLGDDYRGRPITGPDLKIPIVYVDRSHGFSTTAMIQRILNSYAS